MGLEAGHVQAAAGGNFDAFVSLVKLAGPQLRLMIAVHLDSPSALAAVEGRVWGVISTHLAHYVSTDDPSEWILRQAINPVRQHLLASDQRAVAEKDILTHQVIQSCMDALESGSEMGVLALPQRLAGLNQDLRNLVERRYRHKQDINQIAMTYNGGSGAAAMHLMTARAECDWTGIATPPAQGEMMLPSLFEDWLSAQIDPASRELLIQKVSADLGRSAQLLRQSRVHMAMLAYFTPFDAERIAREASAKTGENVVIGSAPAPVARVPASSGRMQAAIVRPTSTKPVATRGARSSGRRSSPQLNSLDTDEALTPVKSSPVPLIIAGVLIAIGVVGLIIYSMSGGTTSSSIAQPQPEQPAPSQQIDSGNKPPTPTTVQQPTTVTTPVPQTPPTNETPPTPDRPLQVMMITQSERRPKLAGTEMMLRAAVSDDAKVKRVEFRRGDEQLAVVEKAPWEINWKMTAGQLPIFARAIDKNDAAVDSTSIELVVKASYGSGTITREWWTNVPGTLLTDMGKKPEFPDKPENKDEVTNFEAPRNWGDNYIQRLRGYIVAPLSGRYIFWISGDDQCELWLSTDESPVNVKRIASLQGAVRNREWSKHKSQQSEPISLVAEQAYYVEVRHKEGGSSDHVAVGWRQPDGAEERPIPGVHLRPIRGDEAQVPIPVQRPGDVAQEPQTTPQTPTPDPMPEQPAPEPVWKVVRGVNLGGESVEIAGVNWLSHKQAEAEGATPTNSIKPGPYLDELEWISETNGAGKVQRKLSHTGKPLTIEGKKYEHGLGVHAASEIVFQLDGKYFGLAAEVGIDDASTGGSVEFQVWADGKKVWNSGIMGANEQAKKLEVPLVGCRELKLVVDPNGPFNWDHANWADARFVFRGGNDGTLVIEEGRRTSKSMSPKPDVDADMRSMLSSMLVGTKAGLKCAIKAKDGPARVTLWIAENSASNSHSFDVTIENKKVEAVGEMELNTFTTVGPVVVEVTGGYIDISATPIKGVPQIMGVLVEQPDASAAP